MGKLEVFSWWTSSGEAAGLDQLFALYKKQNPGVDIVNATVAGGAGTNASAVLKTRMLGGDPPDSFQVHMGHELTDTWVVTDKMEPLDAIYTEMGFDKQFPKNVLDIVSYQGHPYSVPVNIHRANVLWYNKKVFADNNLQPPVTFDDFFKAAETLKAKGITPLAFGNKEGFEGVQTFETTAIGFCPCYDRLRCRPSAPRDIEWVHFIWNTWVLLVVLVLLVRFRANRWLWLVLLLSGWHEVEHAAIFRVCLATGASGTPGLLSQGGAIASGLPVSRPDLHFFYNLTETIPLVVGFLAQVPRMEPRALPGTGTKAHFISRGVSGGSW